MTPQLKLYTKPGCHLCEQVEADLAQLLSRHPHSLELVDITADAELMRRYGERIPVLVVGDREYGAPLPAGAIERALREAAARTTTRASTATAADTPPERHRANGR